MRWPFSRISPLLVAVLFAGCAILDPGSDSESGPYVYAMADCAPWDGPALNLIVTESDKSCTALTSQLSGQGVPIDFTSLLVFGISEPVTGSTWSIETTEGITGNTQGWGQQCQGGYDACTPIQHATISFSSSTDGVAVANLSILYADGHQINTRRPVKGCSRSPIPLCG